jgi:hypothetical protein
MCSVMNSKGYGSRQQDLGRQHADLLCDPPGLCGVNDAPKTRIRSHQNDLHDYVESILSEIWQCMGQLTDAANPDDMVRIPESSRVRRSHGEPRVIHASVTSSRAIVSST